ncbi:MAG: long-chain fatty acid--CoA ligase, partial [Comamonadaceae bacterium]|nr:long-chain fatty acid--CoA ligase [Comamonadaceae bacterium]
MTSRALRPMTVGELYDRAVLHGGERVALVDGERRVSYRELGGQACRLAASFIALGLRRSDRIAFLMANCAEYVACEYA